VTLKLQNKITEGTCDVYEGDGYDCFLFVVMALWVNARVPTQ
jgi:hypothetical protein